MELDRLIADAETACDRLVREAFGQQLQHLDFPMGERLVEYRLVTAVTLAVGCHDDRVQYGAFRRGAPDP